MLNHNQCFVCIRDPSEEETVENFLKEEGVEESKKSKILEIIKGMGKLAKLKFSCLCSYIFYVLQLKLIVLSIRYN